MAIDAATPERQNPGPGLTLIYHENGFGFELPTDRGPEIVYLPRDAEDCTHLIGDHPPKQIKTLLSTDL
jgi:hypothetical protein